MILSFLIAYSALVGATPRAPTATVANNLNLAFINSDASLMSRFQRWKSVFKKEFGEMETTAFATFSANDAIIKKTNARGLSYTLGHNKFSDLTQEAFSASQTGVKQPIHKYNKTNVQNYTGSSLPASVDWSQKGVVTEVKNQNQCGACWAFSTTGSVESAYAIASGTLISLSEQQLVDCDTTDGNNGCSGGSMDNAFDWIIANGGICSEADYPYKAGSGECRACKPVVDIGGQIDIAKGDEAGLQAGVAVGPVSVAIEADQSSFQFYTSGVFDDPKCGQKVDHGVLVVGYGSLSGTPYWKVKNSWGATWGEHGYILIGRGNNRCGIAEAASYPIGAKKANGTKPAPTPPPPPSPGPKPNKYVGIDQKDCSDKLCSQCTDNGIFKTNTCLETTEKGLFIEGRCSDDGTSISEFAYSDSKCLQKTGSYPTKANQCLAKTDGSGYSLYTCETSLLRNFTHVKRQDCAQDEFCWTCSPMAKLKVGECTPWNSEYVMASCNVDGTKIVRKTFSDSGCKSIKTTTQVNANACATTVDYRYGIWTCATQ